jgi:glycyl-tRNA synthetase
VGHYLALIQGLYLAAGVPHEKIRFRKLSDEDKAFYSTVAYDLEVKVSTGWLELVACNYRNDYDLGRHSKVSGTDFSVEDLGEKVLPHVFELSLGIDRSVYAALELAMRTDGERRYLALRNFLAPFQVGVFPLVKKEGLPEIAESIMDQLIDRLDTFYDDAGSIGRRYARADEIGVPYCVTVDFDTKKDQTVTVRARDDKSQERVRIDELGTRIGDLTRFPPIRG